MLSLRQKRVFFQGGFFILFVLAPPLDIFRLDLNLKHFIIFGQAWTLGLDALIAGEIGPGQAAWNLFVRGLAPILLVLGVFFWVAWKYGRLYCGWLCPHFSVVETLHNLMERAIGRPSLWERQPSQPRSHAIQKADRRYWLLLLPLAGGLAFLWAVSLLTYLLTPMQVYHNLWHAQLTVNQAIFISVATGIFFIDFIFARHLFCRYGCAVGLFQSLVWMANKKAMVIGYNSRRSRDCIDCHSACDAVCPMRLRPRAIKRHIFSCDQCGSCIDACVTAQAQYQRAPLLQWVEGACALDKSQRDFGYHPPQAADCFAKSEARYGSRQASTVGAQRECR